MKREIVTLIESSRGCTHLCNFCSIGKMYGQSFRTFSLDRVVADIEKAIDTGAQMVLFTDDNILLDTDRFETLCDMIIERKLTNVKYMVQCSSVGVAKSEQIVKKMNEAGFIMVFLGIENVSKSNLKFLKKGNIINATEKAVSYLHKHNIAILGGTIIGLPDDTEESINEVYKALRKLQVEIHVAQVVTPYPKTGLRENYFNEDLITNKDGFEYYDGYWANVKGKNLSSFNIEKIRFKNHLKYDLLYRNINKHFVKNYPLRFIFHLIANPVLYMFFVLRSGFGKKFDRSVEKHLEKMKSYYTGYCINIGRYMGDFSFKK